MVQRAEVKRPALITYSPIKKHRKKPLTLKYFSIMMRTPEKIRQAAENRQVKRIIAKKKEQERLFDAIIKQHLGDVPNDQKEPLYSIMRHYAAKRLIEEGVIKI